MDKTKQDIIGDILIIIEKEKTRLYNSNKFYGELEKVFELLSRLQEEIKNLRETKVLIK